MRHACSASRPFKTLAALACLAVLTAACGRQVAPAKVADLQTVRFDYSKRDVSKRFIRVADWEVSDSQEHGGYGAKYDLEVNAEVGRLTIECNGMRNLLHVGKGTEAQFRELAATPAWWDTRNLEAPVKKLGLDTKSEFRRYWTPVPVDAAEGIIFATRSNGPEASFAGALLFIRHIDPSDRMDFIIFRAPQQAPAESK